MDSQTGRLVKMDQSEHVSTVSQNILIILLIIVSSVIAIISLVTIFFTVGEK